MFTKVKELGGQAIVYGLGDATTKGISFILIPVYLKYLDPAQYGILETLIVTMSLVVTLSNMGLSDAVFRFYFRAKIEDERRAIISTIFFLALAGQILFPALLFWKAEALSVILFKSPEYTFLLALAAANIFCSAFKGIPLAIYRAQKRALTYVSVNCAIAMVMLLTNIYFVVILKKGVLGIILGFLCASTIGVIIVLPTIIKEIRINFDLKEVKRILLYAVPIGLSQLPLTIIFMADRYIMAQVISMSQLGIYTLAHKLARLLKDFLIVPFRLAWGPFMFANEEHRNAKVIYSKMATYFCIIATGIIIGVSIFSVELVNILSTKKEYFEASKGIPILCYAFLFFGLSYFMGTGIRLSGKTYYSTFVMIVAVCINIPMNYFLISNYGYIGAAYTLTMTFMMTTVLFYRISSRLYFIDYELGRIFLIVLLSMVIIYYGTEIRVGSSTDSVLIRFSLMILYIVGSYFIGFSVNERCRINKRIGKIMSTFRAD